MIPPIALGVKPLGLPGTVRPRITYPKGRGRASLVSGTLPTMSEIAI
jgi:hypothetical protein